MTRRNCCQHICESKVFPYGTIISGSDCAICDNWFTPATAVDYPTEIHSITIGGTSYPVFGKAGAGGVPTNAPSTDSLWLSTPPSVYWEIDLATTGKCTQNENVFSVTSPQDTKWQEDLLIGKWVNVSSVSSPIIANTDACFTLSMDSVPRIGFSISYSYYGYRTSYTVASGVLTLTGVVGWLPSTLGGQPIQLTHSGTVIYTGTVTDNTATTLTLDPAPPDGNYSGDDYGWLLPTVYPAGYATPCGGADIKWWRPTAQPIPANWCPGQFAGCSISYDGVTGIVTDNTSDTLTVSVVSPALLPRSFIVSGVEKSGDAAFCQPSTLLGVSNSVNEHYNDFPITVNGVPNTISVATSDLPFSLTTTIELEEEIDFDTTWEITQYGGGERWDVVSPGFSTVTQWYGQGGWPCGIGGDMLSCATDGAKIVWHNTLDIKQYQIGLYLGGGVGNGSVTIYFGPGGTSYFRLGPGQEIALCNGSQTATLAEWPGGGYVSLCVTDTHVVACPSSNYTAMGLELPLGDNWDSPHRIGLGASASTTVCALELHELPCSGYSCCGMYIPGWIGPNLPAIRLVINGGTPIICQYTGWWIGWSGAGYGIDCHPVTGGLSVRLYDITHMIPQALTGEGILSPAGGSLPGPLGLTLEGQQIVSVEVTFV